MDGGRAEKMRGSGDKTAVSEIFSRTETLLGKEAVERLGRARVAVFGIGGVGGHAAEALARSGVKKLDLFDGDVVQESNINRQIIALHSTLGQKKALAMKARIEDISPEAEVVARDMFFLPENADTVDFSAYDYVVDAVDTVAAKIELCLRARAAGARFIAAMGAGNKKDPLSFRVADISQTSVCPLARVMRRELKKRGVERGVKCVYSAEQGKTFGRTPASVAFMPSVMGLIIASEVIKDLIEE